LPGPAPLEILAAQPSVALGHWPTPLEPCDRLREAVGGPRIWLKRDDCTGLAGGGNKTRKLEFLLGRAVADGATGVVTFGAVQSNHARQTAAACAKLGLPCHVVLSRIVGGRNDDYEHTANVLLDRLFGATVHIVDTPDDATARFGELHAADRGLFVILPGGSDEVGTLGYVDGAIELAAQGRDLGVDVARICVAASTSGTPAGLLVGTSLAGQNAIIDVACVYEPVDHTRPEIERLAVATAGMLGCDAPDVERLLVSDETLGPGYGQPTDECLAAVNVLARAEGVLLDPVYTGKAFAHLLRRIERGELDDDADVIFVHTGGSTGLFAYTGEIEAYLSDRADG
jgi:D-cysteine desulfhydrase family pyridoxal phosphate-dependent enzyme